MRKPVTLKRLSAAWMGLQTARLYSKPRYRGKIARAMDVIDQVREELRRKLIFEAGAKARRPVPLFMGQPLGSAEAYTFYDGYASKHAAFINPYRSRP